MTHPNNDIPSNNRFAIFDCPEEISKEQLQEIRDFAEFVRERKMKREPDLSDSLKYASANTYPN